MHQSLGARVQSDAHDAQLCRIGSYTLLLLVEDLPFSILHLKYLVPALCIHACAVGERAPPVSFAVQRCLGRVGRRYLLVAKPEKIVMLAFATSLVLLGHPPTPRRACTTPHPLRESLAIGGSGASAARRQACLASQPVG